MKLKTNCKEFKHTFNKFYRINAENKKYLIDFRSNTLKIFLEQAVMGGLQAFVLNNFEKFLSNAFFIHTYRQAKLNNFFYYQVIKMLYISFILCSISMILPIVA